MLYEIYSSEEMNCESCCVFDIHLHVLSKWLCVQLSYKSRRTSKFASEFWCRSLHFFFHLFRKLWCTSYTILSHKIVPNSICVHCTIVSSKTQRVTMLCNVQPLGLLLIPFLLRFMFSPVRRKFFSYLPHQTKYVILFRSTHGRFTRRSIPITYSLLRCLLNSNVT